MRGQAPGFGVPGWALCQPSGQTKVSPLSTERSGLQSLPCKLQGRDCVTEATVPPYTKIL